MKNYIYILFKLSLFLLFLQSMFAWFFWDKQVLLIFLCLIIILFVSVSFRLFKINYLNIISVILLITVEFYVVKDQNFNAVVLALLKISIISLVLSLKDSVKVELFVFFTRSFALLLSVSLFMWILFLAGLSLPHFEVVFGNNNYYFSNYYFFLYNHMDDILSFPRFSSVFLEPGQLGMITTFLLCSNRFDLKRIEVLVIFISTLFTFSLAAFILLAIAAFIYLISFAKKPILSGLTWILFIILFYLFFISYDNGNNVVNELILNRIGSGNDDLIQNNRFSEEMDNYFNNFLNSKDLFLGIGSIKYESLYLGANAGYKVFIVQHGIVGTLLILLLYFSILIKKQSILAWILFVVYISCFLQASYPLWECVLLIFITAMPFFKSNNNKLTNED